MWQHLRQATLATLLLSIVFCQSARAAEPIDENIVKAAVIYNLLQFVQWPEHTATARNLRLCVLDDGALTAALRGHDKRKVQGLALEVHRIGSSYDELDTCLAVMIESGNSAILPRLALLARARSLLVIGEGPGAAERGAMIGLHTDGGRVTFDINHNAMKRSGLLPSSKILRLARTLIE